jgi:membrane protein YdbS with pleckstrin-like domain
MKIAMSKTREQFPLSTKKPLKKTIPAIFPALVFWAIVLAALAVVSGHLHWPAKTVSLSILSIGIFFVTTCFLIYKYQVWYFQVYFYDLTDDFIIIRKRVFTPREITIPYERIQDVYVDQDLLDRIMGLYDVHLSSATISSGMEAHIDGVERQAADGLKKIILEKVSEKIKKAKSQNS